MNDLLFKRYRRILQRSLLMRLAVIWNNLVGFGDRVAFGTFQECNRSWIDWLIAIAVFSLCIWPPLVKTIVQMVFVNCDNGNAVLIHFIAKRRPSCPAFSIASERHCLQRLDYSRDSIDFYYLCTVESGSIVTAIFCRIAPAAV